MHKSHCFIFLYCVTIFSNALTASAATNQELLQFAQFVAQYAATPDNENFWDIARAGSNAQKLTIELLHQLHQDPFIHLTDEQIAMLDSFLDRNIEAEQATYFYQELSVFLQKKLNQNFFKFGFNFAEFLLNNYPDLLLSMPQDALVMPVAAEQIFTNEYAKGLSIRGKSFVKMIVDGNESFLLTSFMQGMQEVISQKVDALLRQSLNFANLILPNK